MTNCPNCGAPVDPSANRCPYCETPYRLPSCTLRIDAAKLASAVAAGIMTPNEARRRMGFRGV